MSRLLLMVFFAITLAVASGCSSGGNDDSNETPDGKPSEIEETAPPSQIDYSGVKSLLNEQGVDIVETVSYKDEATNKEYSGFLGVYRNRKSNGCFSGCQRPKPENTDDNGDPIDLYNPDGWNCNSKYEKKQASTSSGKKKTVYVPVGDDMTVRDNPKYCLVLSGTPYAMGYQEGYLRPVAVKKMVTQYLREALFAQTDFLLGIKIDSTGQKMDEIYEWFFKNVKKMIIDELEESKQPKNIRNGSRIPLYLIDEMRGVTDGANAALKKSGDSYRVDFEDVYSVNEAVDALFCFVMRFLLELPSDPESTAQLKELAQILAKPDYVKLKEKIKFKLGGGLEFPEMNLAKFFKFGCNGFMLTGSATKAGKTFHGRDFMFPVGGIIQDESCVIVYLPEEGYGLPFATVAPPSFVGQAVGVNSEGLSVGVDLSMSGAFSKDPGVSCLIINRELLQQCSNIDQAISRFRKFERGMPWEFMLVDDENSRWGHGVVLEAGRNDMNDDGEEWAGKFTGEDFLNFFHKLILKEDIQKLKSLESADTADLNPDKTIRDGFMIRGANWNYPDGFKDPVRGSASDPCTLEDIHSYEGYYNGGIDKFTYLDQMEESDEILTVTNHFIIPRMRMNMFHPVLNLANNYGGSSDSFWRYDYMTTMILDRYGREKIDFFGSNSDYPEPGTAGFIIDFLNPSVKHPVRGAPEGFKTAYLSYMPENRDVEGHHVVINNSDRVLKGLYGYMTDPWVGIELAPFVNWWEAR